MKIVLLGKTGMLGSYFLKFLSGREDFEIYAFDRKSLDVTDRKSVFSTFKKINPDFIINCTAYTNVEMAENEKALCDLVNVESVKYLAEVSSKFNIKLIHFSTDYVFDGQKNEPYIETDTPNPLNYYGFSKLNGEKAILDLSDNYYIVRTAWLFGPNGKNFVDTIVSLAQKHPELNVVEEFGSPTYTHDLVKSCFDSFILPISFGLNQTHECFLGEFSVSNLKPLDSGIFHIVNSGSTSRFDFVSEILNILKYENKVNSVSADFFNLKALRPKNSALLNTKLENLRPWKEALSAYLGLLGY